VLTPVSWDPLWSPEVLRLSTLDQTFATNPRNHLFSKPSTVASSSFSKQESSKADLPNLKMGDIGDGESRNPYPIAICGMALRLPGGLSTPQELWDFLLAKRDGQTRVPESRYNVSAYLSGSKKTGTVESQFGYFLDHVDLRRLDASFFSMTRTELEKADPQQRQLLEVTRECFESAGETDYRGKNIGSYVGSFGEDWLEMFAQDQQQHGVYRVSGSGDFVLSNRLSYEWDLKGPR
jgi:acyl transferase domain-containing protein